MVAAAFTLSLGLTLTRGALLAASPLLLPRMRVLDPMLFIADREAYEGAELLMETFGEAALAEAAARAERSRGAGNHIHYTRWCRVGRTILQLGDPDARGTLH